MAQDRPDRPLRHPPDSSVAEGGNPSGERNAQTGPGNHAEQAAASFRPNPKGSRSFSWKERGRVPERDGFPALVPEIEAAFNGE
jgi:hypothetical protein